MVSNTHNDVIMGRAPRETAQCTDNDVPASERRAPEIARAITAAAEASSFSIVSSLPPLVPLVPGATLRHLA
jgi:hypothetical protein